MIRKTTAQVQPVISAGYPNRNNSPAPVDDVVAPSPDIMGGLSKHQQHIIMLQTRLGNAAVARMIKREAIQRMAAGVIQRWVEPATAQHVLDFLPTASLADLDTMFHSLDVDPGDSDHMPITLPEPITYSIATADGPVLRDRIMTRLIEAHMEHLATARGPLLTVMNAATDPTSRRAAMVALRAVDEPELRTLRSLNRSGRANRWSHPVAEVQDAVLAAIQLEAVFRADGQLDHPTGVHHQAAQANGMDDSFDWCGFFTSNNFMQSDLDGDLRAGFFHVTNVQDYFNYRYAFGPSPQDSRVKKWIYADGQWNDLHEYHIGRSSERHWITARDIQAGGNLDIRSGDVVLIDVPHPVTPAHPGPDSPGPDHIVMVQSYDPITHMLFTIGGNDGGFLCPLCNHLE